jgi:hypothetical protein
MQGVLEKQADLLRVWRPRWFVLTSEGLLSYWVEQTQAAAQLAMPKCTRHTRDVVSVLSKEGHFSVQWKDGSCWNMRARDNAEHLNWVVVLKQMTASLLSPTAGVRPAHGGGLGVGLLGGGIVVTGTGGGATVTSPISRAGTAGAVGTVGAVGAAAAAAAATAGGGTVVVRTGGAGVVLLRERDAETAAAAEATKERDHAKVLCLFAYVHALCCVVVVCVCVCVCVSVRVCVMCGVCACACVCC